MREPLRRAEAKRNGSVDGARFRRSICQGIPQDSQHVRNAKGLVETNRLVVAPTSRGAFEQVAGHVHQQRFLCSGSFEVSLGSLWAIHSVASGRKVQVPTNHVM